MEFGFSIEMTNLAVYDLGIIAKSADFSQTKKRLGSFEGFSRRCKLDIAFWCICCTFNYEVL